MLGKTVMAVGALVCAMTPNEAQAAGRDPATCLAKNIYHEARGEGWGGMVAVGLVTLNRVHHERWPDTVCGVVYQRKQFSWTIHGEPPITDQKSWQRSQRIAKALLDGSISPKNDGATHYVHVRLEGKKRWMQGLDRLFQKGRHVFYRQDN